MNDNEKLKSINKGTLTIAGKDLKFHTLSDGRRTIEEQSLSDFFELLESGKLTEQDMLSIAKMAKSK